MRTTIFILLVILTSCKKDSESVLPDNTPTTYQVKNQTDGLLVNTISYYQSFSTWLDTCYHYDLAAGAISQKVTTTRPLISVCFNLGATRYYVSSPYAITEHTNNILMISGTTNVHSK